MKLHDIVKIDFVDKNPEVIDAISRKAGKELKNCKFIVDDILKQPSGSLLSPANSFGDMNGGIDLAYKMYFPEIESRIKQYIKEYHGGELQIGRAQIIPTHDPRFPNLVFSPTIRTSNDLATPQNIYDSMYAALVEVVNFNLKMEESSMSYMSIDRLLVPGMGTGFGRLSPEIAAREMKQGYIAAEHYLNSIMQLKNK